MSKCDPNLHGGHEVDATFLVMPLVNTSDKFESNPNWQVQRGVAGVTFACCEDHVGHAIEHVMNAAEVSQVMVRAE